MFDKISFDDETTLHAWKSELHVINWTKLVIKKSIQTNSRSKSLEKFFTNNIFYQIYNEFSDALILFRGILFYSRWPAFGRPPRGGVFRLAFTRVEMGLRIVGQTGDIVGLSGVIVSQNGFIVGQTVNIWGLSLVKVS